MKPWLALALGSLAGGFGRYALSQGMHRWLGSEFPYGTLAANLIGCLLVGLFDAVAERGLRLEQHERLLLMTGFCGAFTTFSALMLESEHLLRGGHALRAAANLAGSVLIGLLLVRVGLAIGRAL